jgi:hypothetical protein
MATRKVVLVLRLKPGAEQQLMHDLPIEFPAEALSKIDGIKEITICSGNELFVAIVEYKGDFEKIYRQIIESPSVRSFQFKIAHLLLDPPHSTQPSELPLAGEVFNWNGKEFRAAAG